jgi:hypothetical protein
MVGVNVSAENPEESATAEPDPELADAEIGEGTSVVDSDADPLGPGMETSDELGATTWGEATVTLVLAWGAGFEHGAVSPLYLIVACNMGLERDSTGDPEAAHALSLTATN